MIQEKQMEMEALAEDRQYEIENRIKNLLWTVSGDYSLEIRPDVPLFLRSQALALYDGIKQGAFARYFDKEKMGMYLVKKIFLQADEEKLTQISQLCIEEAIGQKILEERPGVEAMQKQAFLDILEQEYGEEEEEDEKENIPRKNQIYSAWFQKGPDPLSVLRLAVLRDKLENGSYRTTKKVENWRNILYKARTAETTEELIAIVDQLYNTVIDPDFEKRSGNLQKVLSVTLEDLSEYDWRDFLTEEMYEDALESYVEQLSNRMTGLEDEEVTREMDENRRMKHKITVLPPEILEKSHTYVELNYGKSYITESQEKKMNYLLCRGIHADCSLYYTEGILKNPVKRNYQLEYAKRLRNKNVFHFHDKHRIAKRNIAALTTLLKKTMVQQSEIQEILSDRGQILPNRVWRVGRTHDARLFKRRLSTDNSEFVVDILIDASGSQMSRQGQVALQGYMLAETLCNVGIPNRVMSFCTFWDYTILHRLRDYEDPQSVNDDIFNYVTSSNNRDGLAIKAAGHDLLNRQEEKKILIVLSDGRPYDVVVNRPNARNPIPYEGSYAIEDTAFEVRKLRNLGVSVLGVFAGEEKDLAAEKKIFGKDFAYIRDVTNFSRIVGRYLIRQLEQDN